jgi:hypothetical protein
VRFDKIANELKAKYPDDPRTATKLLLEEIRSEPEKWTGATKRLH